MRFSLPVLWSAWHFLHLFQFHQEAFVLRRERVGIHDGRSNDVGHSPGLLTPSQKSPVNREPDLMDGFAGYEHGLNAFGDHRLALNGSAGASDPHHFAALEVLLFSQLFRYLDKEFRL